MTALEDGRGSPAAPAGAVPGGPLGAWIDGPGHAAMLVEPDGTQHASAAWPR